VVTSRNSYPVPLAPGRNELPSGAEVVLGPDRLELSGGKGRTTVNDVEVHGPIALHPGDVLAQEEHQYLVLPAPDLRPDLPLVLEHSAWQLRLGEEIAGAEGSFAVLLGRSAAFTPEFVSAVVGEAPRPPGTRRVAGSFAHKALEFLLLGEPSTVDGLRQFISEKAARDGETVRWGTAWFPRHGGTAEELWSVAADRLLGLEELEGSELVWSDPCMTRLRALADRWARRPALALLGDEGVGREALARAIRSTGSSGEPFVVHRGARFDPVRWSEDVARASGGSLHVRRPGILPENERRAFWRAQSFRPSAGLDLGVETGAAPQDLIVIPQLSDRPADVGPIAEMVLHAVDIQLGRRRSSVRAETRSLLQTLLARENVRTLRNVVIRAALNVTGAEVRPEHLDFSPEASDSRGVRAKVRETERMEIEAALDRSGWNVSEAARTMELPRRTLVYRMARLGLRRPG
jgi:Bacterial regulatory protein, Fis family